MMCREKLSWNGTLSEECLKGILKLVLKFSCMVSQIVVHQITVVAYIFDIAIIIALPHPLFFRNIESHQLNYKLFPFRIASPLLLAKSMKTIFESLIPIIPVN